MIVPHLSMLTTTGANAWPAANTAMFSRFSLTRAKTLRYVNWRIDAASGNYQLAVVRLSGSGLTSSTRVASTGVVATPAAGDLHISLGATALPPGDYAVVAWSTTSP